ncbi:MAG: TetR/AcrR family transcriptional regulator [Ilumatobacteraceae bacterium]
MNQRELGRQRTRAALAENAIRLFHEQGYDDTTVEQIAAAAGVSERTFFLHFATKAMAAFADHDERVESFRKRLGHGDVSVNPLPHLVSTISTGLARSNESRRIRYALLGKVSALQMEDARTDRDYERVVADYLLESWGVSVGTRLRANAVANAVLGVVRASLIAWGEDDIDPVVACSRLLGAMLCSPFDFAPESPLQ